MNCYILCLQHDYSACLDTFCFTPVCYKINYVHILNYLMRFKHLLLHHAFLFSIEFMRLMKQALF